MNQNETLKFQNTIFILATDEKAPLTDKIVVQYTVPAEQQLQNKNGVSVGTFCAKNCKKKNCSYRHDVAPATVLTVANTNPASDSLEANTNLAFESSIDEKFDDFSNSVTLSYTKSETDLESIEARKKRAKKRDESRKKLRVICLIIALIVHSLLEGLAVGLQTTTAGLVSIILLIGFHKSIMGFSLGVNIATSQADLRGHLKSAVSEIVNFQNFRSPSVC